MKEKSFSLYNEVGKEPLLSHAEEINLAKLISAGDKRARDKMIKANLRLAVMLVKKYAKKGVDTDDLFQESVIGLARAVDQFDHTKGYRFATYAYWWIQQSVRKCVSTYSNTIALPANTNSKMYKISQFEKEYKTKFGKMPTESEIADMFGTTTETLKSLRSTTKQMVSINEPAYKGSDNSAGDIATLGDIIPSHEKSVEQKIDDIVLSRTIKRSLATLTPREKFIIMKRFGLDEEDITYDNASW